MSSKIAAAVIYWGLYVGYSGAPSYDMSEVDSFTTKQECYKKLQELVAHHPQYLTARCSRRCKGTNRACREAGQEYMEETHEQ